MVDIRQASKTEGYESRGICLLVHAVHRRIHAGFAVLFCCLYGYGYGYGYSRPAARCQKTSPSLMGYQKKKAAANPTETAAMSFGFSISLCEI